MSSDVYENTPHFRRVKSIVTGSTFLTISYDHTRFKQSLNRLRTINNRMVYGDNKIQTILDQTVSIILKAIRINAKEQLNVSIEEDEELALILNGTGSLLGRYFQHGKVYQIMKVDKEVGISLIH